MSSSPVSLDTQIAGIQKGLSTFIEKNDRKTAELAARTLIIEQQMTSYSPGGPGAGFGMFDKSIGQQIIESDGFVALRKGARSTGAIEVKSFRPPEDKTVVSGIWSSPPQFLPIIATPGQRRLVVRDLLPQLVTVSNMIEFAREDSMTGGAGYQTPEGSTKPESSFTYSLQTQPVVQLAHWLGASRQLLDDSVAFAGYVNGRMMYLLQLKEETELLFGDSSTGHLEAPAQPAPHRRLIAVGQAISALAAVDREADSVVVNVVRLVECGQAKASTADLFPAVRSMRWFRRCGLALVATPSMPSGHFWSANFRSARRCLTMRQRLRCRVNTPTFHPQRPQSFVKSV
jgi:hypothetical protein